MKILETFLLFFTICCNSSNGQSNLKVDIYLNDFKIITHDGNSTICSIDSLNNRIGQPNRITYNNKNFVEEFGYKLTKFHYGKSIIDFLENGAVYEININNGSINLNGISVNSKIQDLFVKFQGYKIHNDKNTNNSYFYIILQNEDIIYFFYNSKTSLINSIMYTSSS